MPNKPVYQITFRNMAEAEYAEATKWYLERSQSAAANFVTEVEEKLNKISENPRQYRNSYKQYYETNLLKYPYSIVFIIEESLNRVVIIAIYHHSRQPRKKYRK